MIKNTYKIEELLKPKMDNISSENKERIQELLAFGIYSVEDQIELFDLLEFEFPNLDEYIRKELNELVVQKFIIQ